VKLDSGRVLLPFLFVYLFLFISSSSGFAQDYVADEIIIKMKGKLGNSSQSKLLGKLASEKGVRLKGSIPGLNMHHMSLKSGTDMNQFLKELKADPNVEFAEPNYILRKVGDANSDQKLESYSRDDVMQGMAVYADGNYQQSNAPVHATEAWLRIIPASVNTEAPIVAVIDTGIDHNHTVFKQSDAIWTNTFEIAGNGVDDDNNGFIDDVHGWNFLANTGSPYDDDGHGTHVCGIVIGTSLDILASAVPQSPIKVMPLKFLGADGSGSTAMAVKAIYYAVNNGARVINNSWGGSNYSASLHEAIAYAFEHNVVLIAASGNSGKDNDVGPIYPSSLTDVPSMISVAAINDMENLASFSNYGKLSVHIAAPGVSIISTLRNNTYGYSSGTSMAAPFVAGLAALAIREAPNLTAYQIKELLLDSGTDSNSLQLKLISGRRVDVLQSVIQAQSLSGSSPYQPDFQLVYKSENRAPASEEGRRSGGCGTVSTSLFKRPYGDNGTPFSIPLLILAIMVLPLVIWRILKIRNAGEQYDPTDSKHLRKYDRFAMKSEIVVKVNGRELVGSLNTISVGGLSFDTDSLIENGGIVTMNVRSPDGKETIQVEGHVVWNDKNHAYGVQFDRAHEGVVAAIRKWTLALRKV
jgi:subtilisin family serine protease